MTDQSSFEHPADLVHRDPEAAFERAQSTLADPDATPYERAVAHWTIGLVHRERGNSERSTEELDTARTVARADGHAELAAEVSTTLALHVANRGDVDQALELLAESEADVTGLGLGRLVMQRALILYRQGLLDDAAIAYGTALDIFVDAGEERAESRLRVDVGLLEIRRARLDTAATHLRRAIELALRHEQRIVHAVGLHNMGYLELQQGNLPAALAMFADAEVVYGVIDNTDGIGLVEADRAIAFAYAGIYDEAVACVDRAIDALRASENSVDLADVLVLAGQLAIASGEMSAAVPRAAEAAELYRSSSREPMALRADLLALEADRTTAETERLVERAEQIAIELDSRSWFTDAAHAWLVAASLAADGAHPERFAAAAERFRRRRGLASLGDRVRMRSLLAAAALRSGDEGRARTLITRGLNDVWIVASSLGAFDMRAHLAAAHDCEELAQLGYRLAVASGRPRELLDRTERVRRAASISGQGVQDRELAETLATLRVVNQELRSLEADGTTGNVELLDKKRRLETGVRHRARQHGHAASERGFDVGASVRALGERRLLEYVEVDGELHLVSAISRRTRLRRCGAVADVRQLVDGIEFGLHRLNREGASDASISAARDVLTETALEVDRLLIPDDVRAESGPIVIVPTSEVYGVPWGLLPSIAHRPIVVSASLQLWHDGSTARPAGPRLLIAGPGLRHGTREIEAIAGDGDPLASDRLVEDRATVANALAGLEGATIAHLACHGSFRVDNPMFSSLRLVDGDLTVYDLEQCRRLPHTIVMSACNAGQSAALRGGALLGLAGALIQLGVANVIAPISPVNDERSVEAMVRLHARLAAGDAPADALMRVRAGTDGSLDPTVAPFVCFGR